MLTQPYLLVVYASAGLFASYVAATRSQAEGFLYFRCGSAGLVPAAKATAKAMMGVPYQKRWFFVRGARIYGMRVVYEGIPDSSAITLGRGMYCSALQMDTASLMVLHQPYSLHAHPISLLATYSLTS